MDPIFGKKYSLEVPKLVQGLNQESFHVDRSFFEAFEFSSIRNGDFVVRLEIMKYTTHLDTKFFFDGWVELECDRCMEPYRHTMKFQQRIVYAYDEQLEFDTDEVVLIDESEPLISFATDIYDFIHLQIPLRKVPSAKVHLCAPEVLALLNLNPDGTEKRVKASEEPPIDPRWQALKKLKDSSSEQ